MPDRKHLWRGIHDPQMVKKGLEIQLELDRKALRAEKKVRAKIYIKNKWVGHYFPTYVAPAVFVRFMILDSDEKLIEDSWYQTSIMRHVILDGANSREVFDTRIPPDQTYIHEYEYPFSKNLSELYAEIEVHPDWYYHNHVYKPMLGNNSLQGEARKYIRQAYEESGSTAFLIFSDTVDLQDSL